MPYTMIYPTTLILTRIRIFGSVFTLTTHSLKASMPVTFTWYVIMVPIAKGPWLAGEKNRVPAACARGVDEGARNKAGTSRHASDTARIVESWRLRMLDNLGR